MNIFKGLGLGWHTVPYSQKQNLTISKILLLLLLKCITNVTMIGIMVLKPMLC